MNAILTRFLGPTDHRGARIVATADAPRGRLVTGYRHELSDSANHADAALALARDLRWLRPGSRLVQGRLPSGDVAHVIVLDDTPPTPTVLIVRHPDAETAVTVSPNESAARIIVADLGSSFDGQPDPESPDEMDAARELAADLRAAVVDLAYNDDVRRTALAVADELEHPWGS